MLDEVDDDLAALVIRNRSDKLAKVSSERLGRTHGRKKKKQAKKKRNNGKRRCQWDANGSESARRSMLDSVISRPEIPTDLVEYELVLSGFISANFQFFLVSGAMLLFGARRYIQYHEVLRRCR